MSDTEKAKKPRVKAKPLPADTSHATREGKGILRALAELKRTPCPARLPGGVKHCVSSEAVKPRFTGQRLPFTGDHVELWAGGTALKTCPLYFKDTETGKVYRDFHLGKTQLLLLGKDQAAKAGLEPGVNIRVCHEPHVKGSVLPVRTPAQALRIRRELLECAEGSATGLRECAKARGARLGKAK